MMRIGPELLARLLLVVGSLLIALALAEVGLRMFLPDGMERVIDSASHFPRYVLDGKPTATRGFYVGDTLLPFALKPGYRHTLVARSSHPVPFRISLDEFGYRNLETKSGKYDLVVVGDSIVFGYGVNDEETVAAQLRKMAKTYNMGIPDAGPEMYMGMIDRFLGRADTAAIALLLFEGNDYRNLNNAYWEELQTCSPPGGTKIIRKDAAFFTEESATVDHPLAIVRLLQEFFIDPPTARVYSPCELLGTYEQVSGAALNDLGNLENYEIRLAENMPRALSYLGQLADASCVDEAAEAAVEGIAKSIHYELTGRLADRMQAIAVDLAGKNCYPIGTVFPNNSGRVGLLGASNYYAGYYYDLIQSLRNGYDGNLQNFRTLLDQVADIPGMESERDSIRRLQEMLASRSGVAPAVEIAAELGEKLTALATACVSPDSCDREDLFLDYLDSLTLRGIDVTVFTLPGEYELVNADASDATELPEQRESQMCKSASSHRIGCLDLSSKIDAHYRVDGANSLYLDGSHLTVEGSAQVAEWIAAELGL
jgi:hypothetical protein